jgi:hypothetical protein
VSCADVETECGKNHGVVVVRGVPLACRDAERPACRVGTIALGGDPSELRAIDPVGACLSACGGAHVPGEDEEPGPLQERSFTSSAPAPYDPNLGGSLPSAFP